MRLDRGSESSCWEERYLTGVTRVTVSGDAQQHLLEGDIWHIRPWHTTRLHGKSKGAHVAMTLHPSSHRLEDFEPHLQSHLSLSWC